MNNLIVSVILPTYNRADFLREAIESILNQTFTDFELIVINDGSTDGTDAMINSLTDERIQYISYQKNKGVSFARNQGLDAARGKYIAFMDSDDISQPERFMEQVRVLNADGNLAICGSNIRFFGQMNSDYNYTESPLLFRMKAVFQTPFHFPACMIRKAFLEKENIRFRPEIRSSDDYYFLMNIVAKGKAFVIQKQLYLYRWHGASISLKNKNEQSANELKISHLAFQKILNYSPTDVEMDITYRFNRGKLREEELLKTKEVIQKIIRKSKEAAHLSLKEKNNLENFLFNKLDQTKSDFAQKRKSNFSKFIKSKLYERLPIRTYLNRLFRS
ncbi:MAG: glycosyltransferase involved in cell wall biosynthesis [Saprospiraceae bacterium]|jgi:glycosyltransferase involved in cell wall biosynthesis